MFQTNHIVANYRRPTFEGLQHKIDNKGIKLDDKTPHYLIFKQPISIFTLGIQIWKIDGKNNEMAFKFEIIVKFGWDFVKKGFNLMASFDHLRCSNFYFKNLFLIPKIHHNNLAKTIWIIISSNFSWKNIKFSLTQSKTPPSNCLFVQNLSLDIFFELVCKIFRQISSNFFVNLAVRVHFELIFRL